MTATYQTQNSTTNSGYSITITKPSGVVQNDLMLAFICCHANAGDNYFSCSGWTRIGNYHYGGGGGAGPDRASGEVFYKFAGASEGSNYQFSTAGASMDLMGAILRYNSVDTAIAPTCASGGSASGSVSCPTITASYDDMVLMRIAIGSGWVQPLGTISGYTSRVSYSSASGYGAYRIHEKSSAVNSGSQGTASMSSGAPWAAFSVLIKSAVTAKAPPPFRKPTRFWPIRRAG